MWDQIYVNGILYLCLHIWKVVVEVFFFFLLHSRSFKAQSIKKVGSQEDLKVFRDDSDWNIVWEARTMYKEEKTGLSSASKWKTGQRRKHQQRKLWKHWMRQNNNHGSQVQQFQEIYFYKCPLQNPNNVTTHQVNRWHCSTWHKSQQI